MSNQDTGLTFRRLQELMAPWARKNFGGDRDAGDPLLGAVEELGELAHAHLKGKQGIRGTADEHTAAAKDAVADTIIYLADYCNVRGFDLESIMLGTLFNVLKRDWKADPERGGAA